MYEDSMQVMPYLNFNGRCEEAFKMYEQCLGGKLGSMFRYAGSPMEHTVPSSWDDKIMHGSMTVGELVLMGADVMADHYEEPKGFSLSVSVPTAPEAERIFGELASHGRVVMPLEQTFWAERFGMVVDRFGIPWMISCEVPNAAS